MPRDTFGNAVVIGGSMAGLLCARVLADHFQTVTLVERDPRTAQPEYRRGVPQGRHAHVLLLRGQQTVFRLFPEAYRSLLDAGAVAVNMGRDFRWFHFGVWKCSYESALDGISASRSLIEWTVGEHLRRLPNVTAMDGWSVEGLMYNDGRVTGVRVGERSNHDHQRMLSADLVVDASGRGSQVPLQLEAFGFQRAPETVVRIDVCYASRVYRMPTGVRSWKVQYVIAEPPAKRAGLIMPLEGDRWIVTLVGMHGDHPPTDADGFLAFAKSLPVPDLYEALRDAEPITPITRFGYPAGQRRHYEKLQRFPVGLIVAGDALCSFNPIYGQGMSAASMYADVLEQCLHDCAGSRERLANLWKSFFLRAAKVAAIPWEMATGEDLRFPETVGARRPALRFLHWYTSKVHIASRHSPEVAERLYEVMHLLKAPATLFKPQILWKLLAAVS